MVRPRKYVSEDMVPPGNVYWARVVQNQRNSRYHQPGEIGSNCQNYRSNCKIYYFIEIYRIWTEIEFMNGWHNKSKHEFASIMEAE